MAAITLSLPSLGDNKPALQASVAPSIDNSFDDHAMASKGDSDGFKTDIEGRISNYASAHGSAITALDSDFDTKIAALESAHDAQVVAHGVKKGGFDTDLSTEIAAEGAAFTARNNEIATDLTEMKEFYTGIKNGSLSLQVRKLTFVVGSDNVEVTLDDAGDISYVKV